MIKIIYIDDEVNSEKMDSRFEILENQGIDVLKVDNVFDAIPFIKKNIASVNLIVLDIIMPPEDKYTLEETSGGTTTGLRLLKDIRAEFKDIPIMIVSIKRNKNLDDILKLYNVKGYLEKPISSAEIAIAIKQVLN